MAGLQPGQMIAEYRIISKIGKGGMASVYKAYQASVDRYVAIKILSYHLADDEEFLGRFKQEARLIARLEHPNILPIYDYGEDKGVPYLVMRFLDAGTLKDRMLQFMPEAAHRRYSDYGIQVEKEPGSAGSRMPIDEIDSIFSQLADALGYAHDNGVIHRDIKPSNIMLDRRGRVFMTDFGIAKLIEPTHHGTGGAEHRNVFTRETVQLFTATGAITGTPDYMSPEQAQGLRLDQRSDIYSLGVVLFELLTGKVPFDAETPMAVILKQISEPLPPPSLYRTDLHLALEAALLIALEKSPAKRYSSMHEFLVGWKEAFVEAKLAEQKTVLSTDPVLSTDTVFSTVPDLPYSDLEPRPGTGKTTDKEQHEETPLIKPTPTPVPRPSDFRSAPTARFEEAVNPPNSEQAKPSAPRTAASAVPLAGSLHALEPEPWAPQVKSTAPGSAGKEYRDGVEHRRGEEQRENFLSQYIRPGDEARIFLQRRHTEDQTELPSSVKYPTAINRRILLIASSVALAIILLLVLEVASNLLDFLHLVWR